MNVLMTLRRAVPVGLTAATLLAASLVHAQGTAPTAPGDRIEARQDAQAARIQQGVASGQLTRAETARLDHQQNHVQHLKQHAQADGQITPREAVRVNKAQNHASRSIHRAKHNHKTRPAAHG